MHSEHQCTTCSCSDAKSNRSQAVNSTHDAPEAQMLYHLFTKGSVQNIGGKSRPPCCPSTVTDISTGAFLHRLLQKHGNANSAARAISGAHWLKCMMKPHPQPGHSGPLGLFCTRHHCRIELKSTWVEGPIIGPCESEQKATHHSRIAQSTCPNTGQTKLRSSAEGGLQAADQSKQRRHIYNRVGCTAAASCQPAVTRPEPGRWGMAVQHIHPLKTSPARSNFVMDTIPRPLQLEKISIGTAAIKTF